MPRRRGCCSALCCVPFLARPRAGARQSGAEGCGGGAAYAPAPRFSVDSVREDNGEPGAVYPEVALRVLFSHEAFSTASLIAARGVCQQWREIARENEVRKSNFLNRWGVLGVHGKPATAGFYWEGVRLEQFVYRHPVKRCDTPQRLALQYNSHVLDIKRVNNIISDFSLLSRSEVFIPVSSKAALKGVAVQCVRCPNAIRDFFVLMAECPANLDSVAFDETDDVDGVDQSEQAALRHKRRMAKMTSMLSRSLRIDNDTAHYYITEANGDLKAALQLHKEDMRWEDASENTRTGSALQGIRAWG